MFADISGSTALYQQLGDAAAHAVVTRLIGELVSIGQRHGGRLIKTIGDEIMMWFPDARSAVDAAVAMQTAVDAREIAAGEPRLSLRVGLHAGPMQHHDGDVFGNTVNTAARLTGLAKMFSITTDIATVHYADNAELAFRHIGAHAFAGLNAPLECVEILWTTKNLTDDKAMPSSAPPHRRLSLRFGGEQIVLPMGGTLNIGRAPENQIRAPGERVSQRHATIASTVNNFVLSDVSTHGVVLIIDDKRLVLRREKTMLLGSGRIVLGTDADAAADPQRTIAFEVVEVAG